MFVATNAPGLSAYNPVERRMAPLSKAMAGVVLPHDYYGDHLDDQGQTIDNKLEKRNFKRAAECLADVSLIVVICRNNYSTIYLLFLLRFGAT